MPPLPLPQVPLPGRHSPLCRAPPPALLSRLLVREAGWAGLAPSRSKERLREGGRAQEEDSGEGGSQPFPPSRRRCQGPPGGAPAAGCLARALSLSLTSLLLGLQADGDVLLPARHGSFRAAAAAAGRTAARGTLQSAAAAAAAAAAAPPIPPSLTHAWGKAVAALQGSRGGKGAEASAALVSLLLLLLPPPPPFYTASSLLSSGKGRARWWLRREEGALSGSAGDMYAC